MSSATRSGPRLPAQHARDRPVGRTHQLVVASRTSCACSRSKGFMRRDPNRPRAVEVLMPELRRPRRAVGAAHRAAYDETGVGDARPAAIYVPVVGRIAAGGPILAEERVEEVFPLPKTARRRRHAVPARGPGRLDGRRRDLRRRLRRDPPAADRRERRDRGRDDRRRGHGQDAQRRPARSGCSRTTTRTSRSTAPTPRSSARSPRCSAGCSRSLRQPTPAGRRTTKRTRRRRCPPRPSRCAPRRCRGRWPGRARRRADVGVRRAGRGCPARRCRRRAAGPPRGCRRSRR